MVVRRVRAVGLVSIVVMLLLGAELTGSPSAHAAQCIQPGPGGGELLVDFDTTTCRSRATSWREHQATTSFA